MNKKILTIENFVVYFPVLFFLLALPYFLKLSYIYRKFIDNTIIWLSYFLIVFFITILIMRRREIGAYLRTIGMVHFLGLLVMVNYQFPEGFGSVGWGYLNIFLYSFFIGPLFSILLILVGSIIDIISIYIRRHELSVIRKLFSILSFIAIFSFFISTSRINFKDFLITAFYTIKGYFMGKRF